MSKGFILSGKRDSLSDWSSRQGTRDPDLGKVVLYQLSYSRLWYPGRDFPPDRAVGQGTPSNIMFIGF